MLKQTENVVKIEGILSEIDLKYSSFMKNGSEMKSITGLIKVRVDTKINNENKTLEIPVHMFASEFKNDGKKNPAFESIERVMNEFTSIAASDIEHADRIRITKGTIQMNEYYNQAGNLVSFPRISASFVTKISKEDCVPEASFNVAFMVGKSDYEVDKDGVQTDKYKITGMLPQYGGKVDVVPFYAISPSVIGAVSQYWNIGDTVKAAGKLNFTSTTEEETVPVDFGEPTIKTRTITVSELVITGGAASPLDGDFAINQDDVTVALKERQERLAALKERSASRGTSGKAPAKTTNANKFQNLGF